MAKFFDCAQDSEQWHALRRPRLNSSETSRVLSSRDYKVASLIKNPSEEERLAMAKRAKRQVEALEILENGDIEASELNSSGLKGLVDKGFATIREFKDSCTLKVSAAKKHIDWLIARGHKDEEGRFTFSDAELSMLPPLNAMERGHELEPLARIEFENITGIEVEEVGYCINSEISSMFGASTDGLVSQRTGVLEIKCPLPHTHLGYLRNNSLPSEYKEQVHSEMAAAEASHAWFVSYCPKLPTLIIKVNRSAYTESLVDSVKRFDNLYESQLAELAASQREGEAQPEGGVM